MNGFSSLSSKPTPIKRNEMIGIEMETGLVCSKQYTLSESWNASPFVDLSSNPSATTSTLVIAENSLSYGNYTFTYCAHVSYSNSSTQQLTSKTVCLDVYLRIVASGLVVNAFSDGIYQRTIGYMQSIKLEPNTYSFDKDSLRDAKNFTFNFYCRLNDRTTNAVSNNLTTVELKSMKSIPLYFDNSFTYCFNSTSDYSFDSNGALLISSGGLKYIPNKDYEFKVTTVDSFGTVYFQLVKVSVDNTVASHKLISIK